MKHYPFKNMQAVEEQIIKGYEERDGLVNEKQRKFKPGDLVVMLRRE